MSEISKETTIRMPIKGLELIDDYLKNGAVINWSRSEYLRQAIFNGMNEDPMFKEYLKKLKTPVDSFPSTYPWCELYNIIPESE